MGLVMRKSDLLHPNNKGTDQPACLCSMILATWKERFLAQLDDRYWVMFLMAKSMFFSQFQGEKSQIKKQKEISPFCDILTALCHSKL